VGVKNRDPPGRSYGRATGATEQTCTGSVSRDGPRGQDKKSTPPGVVVPGGVREVTPLASTDGTFSIRGPDGPGKEGRP
jgi:hypothetical protein